MPGQVFLGKALTAGGELRCPAVSHISFCFSNVNIITAFVLFFMFEISGRCSAIHAVDGRSHSS